MSVLRSTKRGRVGTETRKLKYKLALLAMACVMPVGQAQADTGFWNKIDGLPYVWGSTTNWWTTEAGSTAVAAFPGSASTAGTANFTYGATSGTPLSYHFNPQLGANYTISGWQFNTGNGTNSTLLLESNSATTRTLTYGSGGFSVNNGVLTLASTANILRLSSLSGDTGNIAIANAAGSRALFSLAGGDTNSWWFRVGTTSTSSGGVKVGSGSVVTVLDSENRSFTYGLVTGSYGGLTLAGGTINSPRLTLGGDAQDLGNNNGGIGVATITSGTLNSSTYIILNRSGLGGGTLTLDGGTINHGGTNPIYVGYQEGGKAELNVLSGALNNNSNVITFGNGGTYVGTGIANLNGGTVSTRAFVFGTNASAASRINFNGGTLKAAAGGSGTFLPVAATLQAYVNGAFGSFAGGALIDSNGQNITIATNLLTPTGNGVSTITLADDGLGNFWGGSGYVGIRKW